MSSVTSRITIGRPIEDVFAILTDVEKTGLWYPVDVEEHWTSPPPLGVGSTRHAVVRMGGRRSENDAVVTEVRPAPPGGDCGHLAERPVRQHARLQSRG